MTRIGVVDFDGDEDPLTVDCPPVGALASILYLPVPRWLDAGEVDRRANRLDARWRVFPDLVVCRVHPAQLEDFRAAAVITEDLVARFEGVPVVLLSWDGAFSMTLLQGCFDVGGQGAELRTALAHAELRAVLDRTGVMLPATDDYHYIGPNGEHYESFVRVGTAIQDVDALDAIAFWLLPQLVRSPVIVLDSWTVISLGLNAAQYLRDNDIMGPDGLPARVRAVETRRSYEEPAVRLQQRLVGVDRRENAPPVLAIVSVSSTGDTAQALTSTCKQAGLRDITVLALFRSTETDAPASLCVIDEVSRHWPDEQSCPYCSRRSQTVTVLPDTFLLDLAASVRSDVAIRMTDAALARRFFRRYAGCGAISVHRDQHDRERHHMVYIDVAVLIEHPEFTRGVDRELEDVEGVDLILCPEHDAARALARIVADRLSRPVLEANPERLIQLSASERDVLRRARGVMIVDDVVITGTRLRQYRNMLHREGVAIDPEFELHVLAGVARPADFTRLKAVMEYAHLDERFHFVELLPLPNWGTRECPWCDELAMLRAFGSHAPGSETLRLRFRRLAKMIDGLDGSLFLPWLADGADVTDPMLLGPGSIFEAKTEPELYAAVASSLQALRNAAQLNERRTLPVAKVLSQDFAFDGRYYDTVITACLLRATRMHDLRAAAVDGGLAEMAAKRLSEEAVISLHAEWLFALYRRHMPGGGALAESTSVFVQQQSDDGVRALLRAALRT